MRLWKILDGDVLLKAQALFQAIQEGSKNNKDIWTRNTPFKWEQYYGGTSFNLCTEVSSVIPSEKLECIPVGWRVKTGTGALVPNGRTKEGRALSKELEDKTTQIPYWRITDLVGHLDEIMGSYTIPRIYQSKDGKEVYIQLDRRHDLAEDPRFEEVTESYVTKKLKA